MKRKTTLTVEQQQKLTENEQGQIVMANWLERQLSQEVFEIENMSAEQILNFDEFEFKQAQVKLHFFKHYLKQIKNIKRGILNEND